MLNVVILAQDRSQSTVHSSVITTFLSETVISAYDSVHVPFFPSYPICLTILLAKTDFPFTCKSRVKAAVLCLTPILIKNSPFGTFSNIHLLAEHSGVFLPLHLSEYLFGKSKAHF